MALTVNPRAIQIREPNLLIPGRKPVGSVKVDWSHPLASGLQVFITGRNDLVGGEATISSDSSLRYFAGSDLGLVLKAAGGDAEFTSSSLSRITNNTEWTFFGKWRHSSNSTFAPLYISNNTTGSLFLGIRSSGKFYVRVDSSDYISSAAAPALNQWHTFKITYNYNHTPRMALYIDNLTPVTSAWTDSSFVFGSQRLLDGNDSTWDKPNADIDYFGFYNRKLKTTELDQIEKDPYQFLIPA